MTPPTGLKGAVLRIVVDLPGLTVAEIASELAPAWPGLGEHGGPIRSAEQWRRRQIARLVFDIARWFMVDRLTPKVSRALSRLTSEGWVMPASLVRLTPMGRSRLRRHAAGEGLRLLMLREGEMGDLPAYADQWDVGGMAAILDLLGAGDHSPRELAAAVKGSTSRSAVYRALSHGADLGLWTMPQQRIPSLRAIHAVGGDCPRLREMEAA